MSILTVTTDNYQVLHRRSTFHAAHNRLLVHPETHASKTTPRSIVSRSLRAPISRPRHRAPGSLDTPRSTRIRRSKRLHKQPQMVANEAMVPSQQNNPPTWHRSRRRWTGRMAPLQEKASPSMAARLPIHSSGRPRCRSRVRTPLYCRRT